MEIAFWMLKSLLTEMPVLGVADPSQPYVLQTDASENGLGAVLSQTNSQGGEQPIAYPSWKLLPGERRYSIIEEQCLAVVWVVEFFYIYIYDQSFVIQTDCQPLAWLQQMRTTNSRLTQWGLAVETYCLIMVHHVDGLSSCRWFVLRNSMRKAWQHDFSRNSWPSSSGEKDVVE